MISINIYPHQNTTKRERMRKSQGAVNHPLYEKIIQTYPFQGCLCITARIRTLRRVYMDLPNSVSDGSENAWCRKQTITLSNIDLDLRHIISGATTFYLAQPCFSVMSVKLFQLHSWLFHWHWWNHRMILCQWMTLKAQPIPGTVLYYRLILCC